MELTRFPPEVLITDIRIANESVSIGGAPELSEPIYSTSQITLESSQNDLSFDFLGIHFEDPQRNQYAYYLENYDPEWVQAGPIRSARYPRLPPGEYVFHVKASNNRGVWNDEGTSLAITILPPWWRTTWKFVVYGLAFGVAVFGVDRFQRRRLLHKAREKARERELAHAKEIAQAHTELRQAHDTLKTTQQQFVQSEKMASLGHLTAGIAHEIKNPLNFVNNFAQINEEFSAELLNEIRDNPNIRGEDLQEMIAGIKLNAAQIAKHGKRADQIVSRMMQHATDGKGERYDVAINPFVDELVDISYQSFKARIPDLEVHIEKELSDEVGTLYIAPQEMGQVLQNILSNAFEAVHERASRGDGDYVPLVRVATARRNSGVEIRIEDNGVGIPKLVRDRVFEPFFTTKPTGSGTGLGLSLSYDIVTHGHGGSLSVESEEGAGAAFVIALPDSRS